LPSDDTSISVLSIGDEQVAWTSQSDRATLHLNGVTIALGVRVVAIALGRAHAVMIDSNGAVRVRGRNDLGQCGSSVNGAENEWTLMEGMMTASAVACGPNHTLLVSDGALWTCGFNLHGECGTGGAPSPSSPLQRIDAVPDAVHVVAGKMHSAVLDRDGQLFTFGLEPFGGCEPTFVASHVRSVASGARHIVFVTNGRRRNGLG
jgi:alpha-tubulin suppressor-like RCC1 family protein